MMGLDFRIGVLRVDALVDMGSRRAVDLQAENLWPAVVPASVHLRLTLVDQREVEIGDDDAFAGTQWCAE